MDTIQVDRTNIISILMCKHAYIPWRGQRGSIILVPFDEWLAFMKSNRHMLVGRTILDYEKMLKSNDVNMYMRYFMLDIAWAQYAELSYCNNIGVDCTIILPVLEDVESIGVSEVWNMVDSFDQATIKSAYSMLSVCTRGYNDNCNIYDKTLGTLDTTKLSSWNKLVWKLCIFIQSRSNNKIKEFVNVDWRN